jgi:hypothetical protein
VVSILLLGLAGCGETPKTGDRAVVPPDYGDRKKAIMEGFAKKAVEETKARAKGHQTRP